MADFLTLAAKGIEHTNTSSDTIVFKIYRDLIENYDNFSESLKSNYPRIIVDVISTIINHDSRVNPIIIETRIFVTDGGKTFSSKMNLSNTPNPDSQDVQIAAAGNNVYVTWWERNQTMNEPVMMVSNDNEKTFGEKIMLSEK